MVEKIRSQLNSVKLTLISVNTIAKENAIFCEENENNKTKPVFRNTVITGSSKKKILTTNFNSTEPLMTENHIWWNSKDQLVQQTPKPNQRMFRLPNTATNTANRSKSPFFNAAANKLCNLKINSKNATVRSSSSYKSERIQFNDQDDEICSRENTLFWENLKNMKSPLANTITLGRRFKRNVLKFNIFNSFNSSTETNEKEIEKTENEEKIINTDKMPPLPPSAFNNTVKLTKAKMVKKQKKIKDLEKLNKETEKLLEINQNLYKTI